MMDITFATCICGLLLAGFYAIYLWIPGDAGAVAGSIALTLAIMLWGMYAIAVKADFPDDRAEMAVYLERWLYRPRLAAGILTGFWYGCVSDHPLFTIPAYFLVNLAVYVFKFPHILFPRWIPAPGPSRPDIWFNLAKRLIVSGAAGYALKWVAVYQ